MIGHKSSYGPNQNIVVDYTVANSSKKVAYLVLEPQPQTNVDEKNRFLRIESPVKYQEEWNRYYNDLNRLAPGRSFSGKLVIPRNSDSRKSKVGCGELADSGGVRLRLRPAKADIDELLACKDTSYSFPCLGKLNDIAKIVAVGNMVVEIRSR